MMLNKSLIVFVVFFLVFIVSDARSMPNYGVQPPHEATMYYQQKEQSCKASVMLIQGIENKAVESLLETYDSFEAALKASGLDPQLWETVLTHAKLYYEAAKLPWLEEDDESRIELGELKQSVYTRCRIEIKRDLEEYKEELSEEWDKNYSI